MEEPISYHFNFSLLLILNIPGSIQDESSCRVLAVKIIRRSIDQGILELAPIVSWNENGREPTQETSKH